MVAHPVFRPPFSHRLSIKGHREGLMEIYGVFLRFNAIKMAFG